MEKENRQEIDLIRKKNDYVFWIIITIIMLIIIMTANYIIDINQKMYAFGEKQEATGSLEKLQEETKINQKFIAIDNNLEKIKIDFEPYKNERNVGGKVKITLQDEENKIIDEEIITKNYIRENPEYDFKFKKQKNSKGKEYTIGIEFVDLEEKEKFYSVKYTDNNEYTKNRLYINGEEQKGHSIIFVDYYKSAKRTIAWNIAIITLTVISYILIWIIRNKRNIKCENIFIIIAPIVCILFMIAMPTFKNHDEYYHWLKAYEVSVGNLMTPIKDGVQGTVMPNAVAEICPNDWIKINYTKMKELKNIKIEQGKEGILNPETAAVYSFVQYIPQAVGIAIGRIFTDSAYLLTYAGRIMNLIVALSLLYIAIKIIPIGKKIILIPALIPIAIEGFTSLSPDAMTNSMTFLYIAYILYLTFGTKKKIEFKEKIILTIMSIIIALCKIVYIPLVGLILIIPKEKFKKETNKNKILNFSIIAGIAVIVNLVWLAISSKYLSTFREGDSAIQVLLALKNPIKYIQTLLYTIDLNGNNYLISLFGSCLGWGELVKLHSIIPYAFMSIYFIAAISDRSIKNCLKRYQILWIILVIIAIVGLIFTSLYVQWTTIGSQSILGVQGRYLLPIIPLIMLIIGNCLKIELKYKEKEINRFIGISIVLLIIYTIIKIVIAHF